VVGATGSQVRWRLQTSPCSQAGLHWGTQVVPSQAKPGEQGGAQASVAGAAATAGAGARGGGRLTGAER
jgi:hypothetical protein